MNRATRVLAVVAALGLLSAACGTEADRSERTPLRIPLLPFLGLAPLHVAEQAGYFAEEGFEVDAIELREARDALPALLDGNLDVVAGHVNPAFLNAIGRGADVRFVGDVAFVDPSGCDDAGLIATTDVAEQLNAEELGGKSISFTESSIEGYFLDRILGEAGVSLDAVTVNDVPNPNHAEALAGGQLDLAYTSEPWVTRMSEAGDFELWRSLRDVLPGFQVAVIMFGPTFLRDDPEAGERFMTAYARAHREIRRGKSDQLVAAVAAATELGTDLVERACWSSLRPGALVDTESVMEFQRWAVDRGYLDAVVPVEGFWEPRFAEAANAQLGAED